MAQVGEHGLDGVLRGCAGSSFGHRCHDLGLGLGRGLRVARSFPLSTDCTVVHVLRYCIPSRVIDKRRSHTYIAQIEYLVCIRVRPSSSILTSMRSLI